MRVEQVRLSAQPEPSPAPESVGTEEVKPQK
jgi:hypothetical protein